VSHDFKVGDRVRIATTLAEYANRTGVVVRVQGQLIDVDLDSPLRNGSRRAAFFPGELTPLQAGSEAAH
jgi:hypothetical protein